MPTASKTATALKIHERYLILHSSFDGGAAAAR